MTIKLWRTYKTNASPTEWFTSEGAALDRLRETYDSLTEDPANETPVTKYYYDRDTGDELVVDWLEFEATAEGIANFMNEFAN